MFTVSPAISAVRRKLGGGSSGRLLRYIGAAVLLCLLLVVSRIFLAAQPEELQLRNGRKALFISQDQQAPLLIFLHAATSSASRSFKFSGFALAAQWHGVNLALAESRDGMWRYNGLDGTDDRTDEAYVIELREALLARGLGKRGVFLVGSSNGGMLALQTACGHPRLFQGVGLISSGMPEAVGAECRELPPSVVAVSGESDMVIPIAGGVGVDSRVGPFWSFDRFLNFLQQKRQCARYESVQIDLTSAVAPSVVLLNAAECERAGRTQFYRVVNGGHESYGGDNWKLRLFGTNRSFFAPDLIVRGFLAEVSGGSSRFLSHSSPRASDPLD